jgi:flagellar hook-associated protein 1
MERRQSIFGTRALSLNGIVSSALSALQTNTAALRVVSNNVSNVNTPDYARRVVNLQTLNAGGQIAGVDIASVQRVVDQYLNQEALSASAGASRYDTQSSVYDQINALLGSPGDGTAMTSQLSDVFAALGQAALSPTSSASQDSVLGAMQNLASSISSLSTSLAGLQSQADNQIGTSVTSVNTLLSQIYQLNQQIKLANSAGDTDSSLLDQRDTALQSLAKQMDIRTTPQQDGSMLVSTQDGVSLVGSTYAQLSYTPGGSNGVYQPITIQDVDPQTGQTIGTPQALDPHLTGGSIKGLIDMRDGTLADLQNELGAFAQGVAQSFNAVHNANSAYPPPTSLDGRDTGLVSADSLNFSGKTTIALTDSNGVLQHTIAVDFGAGTITVDGGSPASFSNTVGSFTTVLNSALSPFGASATFSNGALSLSGGTDGVVVSDTDPTNPSSRAGNGFSQFFGLNDLFQGAAPSILKTGVSGSDTAVTSAGEIDLILKGPDGTVAKTANVSITAGMTFSQVVGALNSAMGGYASFTLNPDGSMTTSVAPGYSADQLQTASDTTTRGTTGMSLSAMFGIGANQMARQASGFTVSSAITGDPSRLAFAKPDFTTSQIVGAGDSSGLLALQNLTTSQQDFSAAGSLLSQTTTLGNFAAAFYQDVATRSANTKTNQTTQDDRLTEAQSRQSNESGVNLDEELSNMMVYQQAYAAGARMLNVVSQLYQTLLQIQ